MWVEYTIEVFNFRMTFVLFVNLLTVSQIGDVKFVVVFVSVITVFPDNHSFSIHDVFLTLMEIIIFIFSNVNFI